jgi:hypothetical protein
VPIEINHHSIESDECASSPNAQFFNSFARSLSLSLSFATLAPLSSVIDANIADGNSFSSYGHECLFFLSLALLSNPNNHNREIILPENGLI